MTPIELVLTSVFGGMVGVVLDRLITSIRYKKQKTAFEKEVAMDSEKLNAFFLDIFTKNNESNK